MCLTLTLALRDILQNILLYNLIVEMRFIVKTQSTVPKRVPKTPQNLQHRLMLKYTFVQ